MRFFFKKTCILQILTKQGFNGGRLEGQRPTLAAGSNGGGLTAEAMRRGGPGWLGVEDDDGRRRQLPPWVRLPIDGTGSSENGNVSADRLTFFRRHYALLLSRCCMFFIECDQTPSPVWIFTPKSKIFVNHLHGVLNII